MNRDTKKIILYVALLILAGLSLYLWLNNFNGLETIEELKKFFGISLIFITIPIQIILSVTPFPSEAFAFTSSLLLGFWYGALNNWIAWTVSAFVEYKFVSLIKNQFKPESLSRNKMPNWLKKFPVESPVFLIVGLWMPFGSHIVLISAALSRVDLKKVLICCAIGYIPLSFIISGMANGLLEFLK